MTAYLLLCAKCGRTRRLKAADIAAALRLALGYRWKLKRGKMRCEECCAGKEANP